jgi:hypothetical protein
MSEFHIVGLGGGPLPPQIATKYTTNDGNFAVPVANNLNLFGTDSSSATAPDAFSPWTTSNGGPTVTFRMPGYAKWVVNPVANLGTHTTIQAAINAASAGDDIFITAGTYTENPVLKSGVNLIAFAADAGLNGNFITASNVIINGNCTFTGTGTVTISGIQLVTNGAPFLTVSGNAASTVNLTGCYLNVFNNGGIAFTSTSASAEINIAYCTGSINGALAPFTMNSPGTMYWGFCDIENGSFNPTIPGTLANGVLQFEQSLLKFPITVSSGSFTTAYSQINSGNTTAVALTGGNFFSEMGFLGGGTSPSVTIGVGATATINMTLISTSNATAAISGAGTLNYSGLGFLQAGTNITVTNQNPFVFANSAVQVKIPSAYPYTVLPQDAIVIVDSSVSRTINLTATPSIGQKVIIKDNTGTANTNNITISGNGKNIDGAATLVLNTTFASVELIYNGTQWNAN